MKKLVEYKNIAGQTLMICHGMGLHFCCLFVWFEVFHPIYGYGHVETVGSPNHTFSWASLTIMKLTSTSCTYTFACN